ncbi:MAG: glycerophosphodiester phosphodiesterase [Gemmatimonadaceae bacterium]|nr:glycerophosphodiester phosphodiesterase [Gemmatimonadaceae bacterium]
MTRAADEKKVEWIAHRGESYLAPENTLAAYNLAWKLGGADAGELDVHLTKDNQLVLIHDKDAQRTAGSELVVKDSTMEQLRALDAGSWKDPKYAGEKMPTLAEALATIPDGKRMFIELKVGPEAVPELVRVIKKSGKTPAQLPIISFNADTLRDAKKALPEHKCFYLSSFKQDKQTKDWSPTVDELISTAKSINADGLDLQSKPPLNGSAIQKIKDANLEIYAWTVDDPTEARRLIDAGIQGITTNRPTWLREQVKHPTTGPAN